MDAVDTKSLATILGSLSLAKRAIWLHQTERLLRLIEAFAQITPKRRSFSGIRFEVSSLSLQARCWNLLILSQESHRSKTALPPRLKH